MLVALPVLILILKTAFQRKDHRLHSVTQGLTWLSAEVQQ